MSKRYYICDIIGDGTEDNPYRPAVADLGVAWVGDIPTGPDGHPTSTWALVMVATQNHGPVRARQGVDALPEFPLDGKVSAINAATKTAMENALSRRNLPANTIVDGKDGYRDVIRAIGRANAPGFDENNFDVAE